MRYVQGLVEGKVAIVAGGGRGIGEAVAVELARAGASVLVVDGGASVRFPLLAPGAHPSEAIG